MISQFSLLAEFVLAGNTVFSFNLTSKVNNSHKLQGEETDYSLQMKWKSSIQIIYSVKNIDY